MSRLMWVVPRNVLNTSVIADVIEPCAAGYSGWFGVAMSGRQPDCSAVAAFPSLYPGTGPNPSFVTVVESSAPLMAVTGRQNR